MNGTNIFNGMFGKIEAGLVRLDVHVIEVNDTYITVINYEDSVVENILPERHVFMGSTYFYGKIVSMFNFNKGKKNGGFENILKFKMMSEMMGNGSGNGQNNMMGNMMMLSMMNNGGLDNMFNFDNMFSLGETEESEEENK